MIFGVRMVIPPIFTTKANDRAVMKHVVVSVARANRQSIRADAALPQQTQTRNRGSPKRIDTQYSRSIARTINKQALAWPISDSGSYSVARRQAEGRSEQVIKLFSTIRGSGWQDSTPLVRVLRFGHPLPRMVLNSMITCSEFPSACRRATE